MAQVSKWFSELTRDVSFLPLRSRVFYELKDFPLGMLHQGRLEFRSPMPPEVLSEAARFRVRELLLDFSGCNFRTFQQTAAHISRFKELQFFGIRSEVNERIAEGLKSPLLVTTLVYELGLSKLQGIEYLDLSQNGLSWNVVGFFGPILQKMRKLRVLDLSHNQLRDKGLDKVGGAFEQFSGLEEIRLGWNQISSRGARGVADAIGYKKELRTLDLSHNRLGPVGVACIADILWPKTKLAVLDFSHNEMKDEGVAALARGVRDLRGITHLYLAGNQITEAGVKGVASVLKKNQGLLSLDLSCNPLGDGGMEVLAPALKSCQRLEDLNLKVTGFQGRGVEAFLASLPFLFKLRRLAVPSFVKIGAVVSRFQSLRELELSGKSICLSEACYLLGCFKERVDRVSWESVREGLAKLASRRVRLVFSELADAELDA